MFFYDHIILIHHVHTEVETLEIDVNDKQEVIDLIEETVHHHVIKRILDRLKMEHHQEFLDKFHETPHDIELLAYLKKHIPDIETHIKQASDEVKYEMLKTIRDSSSLL